MAASVPVVAYDDEAFRTVVVHDLNGYLFKDKKDYRKYIKKIMTDKKVFERLSRQARIQGESHSSKYYAEKILDVYYTALGGRKDEGGEKEKKTFFSKMKNVVKKGFNGK